MFEFEVGGGVTFKDDLAPQVLILPPLLSLFDGIEQVAAEMAELGGRGWYAFCEFLPTVPYRAPPRGSTPRKDGGPPRGIVDQGGPHISPFDAHLIGPRPPRRIRIGDLEPHGVVGTCLQRQSEGASEGGGEQGGGGWGGGGGGERGRLFANGGCCWRAPAL